MFWDYSKDLISHGFAGIVEVLGGVPWLVMKMLGIVIILLSLKELKIVLMIFNDFYVFLHVL